jgi:CheY-like chemotaxis protein
MTMHVVHVEDETPLRDILGVAFKAAEPRMTLRQFSSGDEAMSYIESNSKNIDLFVLDIRLPGKLNGLQMARKIRDIKCPGHIVLTSAYAPPSPDMLASLRCDFYPKPWHLIELTEKFLQYKLKKPQSDADTPTYPMAPVPSEPAAALVSKETATCPRCGHGIRPGELSCSECGMMVEAGDALSTHRFPTPSEPMEPRDAARGEALLDEQKVVIFEIGGNRMTLPNADAILIGRFQGEEGSGQVVVDLTPFGAVEKGVSRQHLRLMRRGSLLYVMDQGSSNGTWINGRRLIRNSERVLRDGDELFLGRLQVRVRYQKRPAQAGKASSMH